MPPAEDVARRVRRRVGQRLQHERLGVPERVTVVAGARQALRRDRAQLGATSGLQQLEEGEAQRLLQRRVAVDLDVRGLPEVVEVRALRRADLVPARHLRLGERRRSLRAQRRERAHARPGVREELDEPQLLAGLQLDGCGHAPDVVTGLRVHRDALRALEDVIHRRHDAQPAQVGRVREQHGKLLAAVPLRLQRLRECGGGSRIGIGRGDGLVRDELRLHDDAQALVERLDLVQHRCDRALGERHEPGRGDADAAAGGRDPLDLAAQHAVSQVEDALVRAQVAVAHVERLVVDEQPDELAVRDVDERLPRLREAVRRLGVGQRMQLEEPVQVRAGDAVRLALVQVAAQPDVAVREREDRLARGEQVGRELALGHAPGLDRVRLVADHDAAAQAREHGRRDLVDADAVHDLREDRRSLAAHARGVALHHSEIGPDVRREIGLVDHEQVGLRDARAALARHLVAPGDVDHVDREVGELAAVLGREVVAAGLDEEQLGPDLVDELLEREQVVAHVLADRRVRTAPGLDRPDVAGRERAVPDQELGVLAREDVVRDDAEAMLVPQAPAELEQQRRLAAADGPADADRERPFGEVARLRRGALGVAAGALPLVVRVRVAVVMVVVHEAPWSGCEEARVEELVAPGEQLVQRRRLCLGCHVEIAARAQHRVERRRGRRVQALALGRAHEREAHRGRHEPARAARAGAGAGWRRARRRARRARLRRRARGAGGPARRPRAARAAGRCRSSGCTRRGARAPGSGSRG